MNAPSPQRHAAASAFRGADIRAISGADRASLPWLISLVHKPNSKPLLFISNSENEAEELAHDLQLFLKGVGCPDALLLPAWEFSPYRKIAPSVTARHQRLQAMGALLRPADGAAASVVVTSWSALAQCAPPSRLFMSLPVLKAGARLDPDSLVKQLSGLGYQKSETVEDRGTWCRRGGILDLFIPTMNAPVRVDFFDDEIESVRAFDPATQSSNRSPLTAEVVVWPNREFLCDPESLASARQRIRDWCDSRDLPRKNRERILDALGAGIVTEEMDYLLPLMWEDSRSAWELLGDRVRTMVWEPSPREFQEEVEKLKEQFVGTKEESDIYLPPDELFLSSESIIAATNSSAHLRCSALEIETPSSDKMASIQTAPTPRLHVSESHPGRKHSSNLDQLEIYLKEKRDSGVQVNILCRTEAQLERMEFLLQQRKIPHLRSEIRLPEGGDPLKVNLALGELSRGFEENCWRRVFLPDHEIFGTPAPTGKRRTQEWTKAAQTASALDLQEGDLIVHPEHGVGRYTGIVTLTASGVSGEFVLLEYGGADKLYLPVYRLNLIQRWVGGGGPRPALDKLGSQHFQKAKERARESARDLAADLVRTQAARKLRKGFRFSDPDELFREFEGNFPFEETPDQLLAIQDTIRDMCSDQPMDRLICGDVGFGKTEVAIRAAFKACQDGKQVAVLVPTTVLAEQHLSTFVRRLRDHAVTVRGLSRFRPRAEQTETLAMVQEGKVDILIGTHRILSKDVHFSDLGLLVIDEEQRFGVEHKERLKKLRASVDVLTLSATPIPRTLHMSLMGLRDISVIRTPPAERTSIKTHLAHFDPEVIREAILQEVSRGGQVFFIHNRVETIGQVKTFLEETIPGVSIGIGHGQMPERELEKAMASFYRGETKVLLASTIVENGLDVSNANTIIVNRADTFGLSQLYQIRGRVGRSSSRAHAWLLIPETGTVTDEARQRLQVLQRFTELGSGYMIANYDLELRGGGDILGDSQSGHISAVGYDLYLELLDEEIRRMKNEETRAPREDTEIQSAFAALLPAEYVSETRTRLSLYRKLSALDSEESIDRAAEDLVDRFGPLPKEAEDLLWLFKIRTWGRRMGIKSVVVTKQNVSLTAGTRSRVEPEKVLALIAGDPGRFKLTPAGTLVVRQELGSLKEAHAAVRTVAQEIMSIA